MKALFVIAALFGSVSAANATCYEAAAQRYALPAKLLKAVAKVESSGRPEAMNMGHKARTKSYDIGLMQINSSWLKKLGTFGITEEMLMEPCQNLMVGAWILRHHLTETGHDWNGVGSYNASCRTLSKEQCEKTRYGYSWKVYKALMKLQGTPVDEPKKSTATAGATPAIAQKSVAAIPQDSQRRRIQTVNIASVSDEKLVNANELANPAPATGPSEGKVHEPKVQIAHAPVEETEFDEAALGGIQLID